MPRQGVQPKGWNPLPWDCKLNEIEEEETDWGECGERDELHEMHEMGLVEIG